MAHLAAAVGMKRWRWLAANLALYRLAAVSVSGHRFWLLPFLTLAWPLVLAGSILVGALGIEITPASAQNLLIGAPMSVLAVFLGLRVIAGEVDSRTLEIAYTVPGGCEWVWWAKLAGGLLILLVAEVLLAITAWIFFTPFPLGALYGALQGAVFFLVLATGFATLFRSEVAGAMATAVVMVFAYMIPENVSPFWNPLYMGSDRAAVLAATVQNRVGVALAAAGILSLAFMRANRRERMLDG